MNLLESCAVILLSLTMVNCSNTLWLGENYENLRPAIDSVSIVFPQIEYSVKNVNSKSPKIGYSVHVSKNVAESIKEVLNEGGDTWKSSEILYDSLMVGEWLIENFYKSNEKYKKIRDSLQVKDNGCRTFPMTPELKKLIDKVKTRYFVFATGTAFKSSTEAVNHDAKQSQSFGVFFDDPLDYNYKWYGMNLVITLVDAVTNEIVWYNFNRYNDADYDPLDKTDVKQLCKKLLSSR